MLTLWRGVTLAAMIALLGVGDGRAQATPRGLVEVARGGRAGLWGGVGVGAGGESFDLLDGVGYSSELYKPTVSLRLGGTVNQHLRLGGEILSWIDDQGDQTASLSSFLSGSCASAAASISTRRSIWSNIATPPEAATATTSAYSTSAWESSSSPGASGLSMLHPFAVTDQ
jgi:hypothetical protein